MIIITILVAWSLEEERVLTCLLILLVLQENRPHPRLVAASPRVVAVCLAPLHLTSKF